METPSKMNDDRDVWVERFARYSAELQRRGAA